MRRGPVRNVDPKGPQPTGSLRDTLALLKRRKLPILDRETVSELAAHVIPRGDPAVDIWVNSARGIFTANVLAAAAAMPRKQQRKSGLKN